MPRRKKEVTALEVAAAPEPSTVTTAATAPDVIPPSVGTIKVTRRNLMKVQEKKFLEHVEPMMDEMFTSLRAQVRSGNMRAIQIVAEMSNLVKGGQGVSVIANINQNNSNRAEAASAGSGKTSFEQLVRRLDGRATDIAQAEDFLDVVAG
jgi:hypothetical protein